MKKSLICVLAVVLAAACDSSITDTGRPVITTGNSTSTSSIAGVFIDPGSVGLSVGGTAQLSARAVNASGAPVTGAVSWSSSNGGVVSVDANGRITATGTGNAVVTATVNGTSGSAIVSVT